jgi:hypothetical protein
LDFYQRVDFIQGRIEIIYFNLEPGGTLTHFVRMWCIFTYLSSLNRNMGGRRQPDTELWAVGTTRYKFINRLTAPSHACCAEFGLPSFRKSCWRYCVVFTIVAVFSELGVLWVA